MGDDFRLQKRSDCPQGWPTPEFSKATRCQNAASGGESPLPEEKVEEAKKQILAGENGVFDGVIETNTGETVGEAGKTLDDATITGGINWYFKNVTVVE